MVIKYVKCKACKLFGKVCISQKSFEHLMWCFEEQKELPFPLLQKELQKQETQLPIDDFVKQLRDFYKKKFPKRRYFIF